MLRKKGQSTLEYVIILTAIIGAVLVGVKYFTERSGTHAAGNSKGVVKLVDSALTKMTDKTKALPGASEVNW